MICYKNAEARSSATWQNIRYAIKKSDEKKKIEKEIPDFLKDNLNPSFELRPYQVEAFTCFFHCLNNDFPGKNWPLHFLFLSFTTMISNFYRHSTTSSKGKRVFND